MCQEKTVVFLLRDLLDIICFPFPINSMGCILLQFRADDGSAAATVCAKAFFGAANGKRVCWDAPKNSFAHICGAQQWSLEITHKESLRIQSGIPEHLPPMYLLYVQPSKDR